MLVAFGVCAFPKGRSQPWSRESTAVTQHISHDGRRCVTTQHWYFVPWQSKPAQEGCLVPGTFHCLPLLH